MKMIDFYKSILKLGGMFVNDNDYVKVKKGNDELQVLVDGLGLVMPTREHLGSCMEDTGTGKLEKIKTIFHPLKENIIRSESDVLVKLREAISARLNFTIFRVFVAILELANSPELQKKPNKEIIKVLSMLSDTKNPTKTPNVDDKSISNFERLIDAGMKINMYKNTIGLYIRRGGSIGNDGEKFNRIAVIDFPLYDEITGEDRVVRGTKLRIKDKDVFASIYEYMFPMIDSKEAYMFGSSDKTSPGLVSLLTAAYSIGDRLNKLVKTYKNIIGDDYKELMFNLDWVDYIEDIDNRVKDTNSVPMHNNGEVISDNKVVHTAPGTISPSSISPTSITAQPSCVPYGIQPTQEPPAIARTDRGLDPRQFINNGNQNPLLAAYGNQPIQPQQNMINNNMPLQNTGMQYGGGVNSGYNPNNGVMKI